MKDVTPIVQSVQQGAFLSKEQQRELVDALLDRDRYIASQIKNLKVCDENREQLSAVTKAALALATATDILVYRIESMYLVSVFLTEQVAKAKEALARFREKFAELREGIDP